MEVKSDQDALDEVTTGEQVARYWSRYRLVLVTNLREFQLVGPDPARGQTTLEAFQLAGTAVDFHRKLEKPRAFARQVGPRLAEYLARAPLAPSGARRAEGPRVAARLLRARRVVPRRGRRRFHGVRVAACGA